MMRELADTIAGAVDHAKRCQPLNDFEAALAKLPSAEPPVVHRFTPGLYSREILLKKGIQCTSKIHKTEHQFLVSKGLFEMWSEETGWVMIDARAKPYHGVTKPGTRRAFKIHLDTYFTTFHPTTLTDLKEIEAALIEPDERLERLREQQTKTIP